MAILFNEELFSRAISVKGLYQEHLCEIILNLGRWLLKNSSIFISCYHFVQRSGIIWAILEESFRRNTSVK